MNIVHAEMQQKGSIDQSSQQPIPVTIVTGFLGSGKTTLLNRLLSSDHGLKIAVIVNEFGEISIDHKLITRSVENLIELANGCVCCTASGNLMKAIAQVLQDESDSEYIVIETSGLADPLPVAENLLRSGVREQLRLDSIIALVDAYNFDRNLDSAEAAYNQIVNADILLINKTDLVDPEIPRIIEENLKKLNAGANYLFCVNADIDPHLLLSVDAARLAKLPANEQIAGPVTPHKHDELHDFQTVFYESFTPFDAEAFRQFMNKVPSNVFRGKGVLNIAGSARQHFFHLVGDRANVSEADPWESGDTKKSEVVFIGRDLNREELIARLNDCLADC